VPALAVQAFHLDDCGRHVAGNVDRSTDVKWSNDVGLEATAFVDRGTPMSIFHHGPTPVAGVTVTSNGSVRARRARARAPRRHRIAGPHRQ
jgi:hypothetical protein